MELIDVPLLIHDWNDEGDIHVLFGPLQRADIHGRR
jgi:hypothetical protein